MHSSVAVLLCCARFNENKGTMITLYWHKQKGTINNKKASTSCVAISKTGASFILGRIYLLTQIFKLNY